ncbi:MAG TPA: hypothetical protein VGO57_01630 [Verrucomicrobiae bacterium]
MNRNLFCWLFAFFIGSATLTLQAQGTAFSYQGNLNVSGGPATGAYDFIFALYDAPTNGNAISVQQTSLSVGVTNGLFTQTIDFGTVFTGTNYWLAIAVRPGNNPNPTNTYTVLWPRQPLLPVPYAVFANAASNLVGTLPAGQISGTLSSAQLTGTYSGVVSFTNNGNIFAGNFVGDGSAVANLNGSLIASGTVADARLSANVALLNANQAFTGSNFFNNTNVFTSRGNNFTGSFFGNGLVGWNNISNTTVQAEPDHGYVLFSSGLTTVTLPATTNLLLNDIVRISGAGPGGWLAAENSGQTILGNFTSYQNSQLLASSSGDWHCIAASASGRVMYAGSSLNGTVLISTDSGQSWNSTGITGQGWSAIACSTDGTKAFVLAYGGAIEYTTNSGVSWSVVTGSSGVAWSAIACSTDGTKFIAAVKGGQIYSWAGPTTSLAAFGPGNANWISLKMSSDLSHMVAAAPGSAYLSSNDGGTWTLVPLPAGNPTVAMSTDGLKLAVAISGYTITTTTNFGGNWTVTTAPTNNWSAITASSDASRLMACASNSLVYASANFGATWTPLNVASRPWTGVAASSDGNTFAVTAATIGSTAGNIYYSGLASQFSVSTNASIGGAQGSAVELQYIGGGQFMPVSSSGTIWAN